MNSDIFLKFHGFYTRMYSSHYWILKIKFKTLGELYIIMKKNARNTKGKIVSAAWKLFYQQGYDNTTIEEIVEASGTSRGSFYHYFEGKDALLSSLSYLFDDKYVELEKTMDPVLSPIEKLKYINQELFPDDRKHSFCRAFEPPVCDPADHQRRASSAQHQPYLL